MTFSIHATTSIVQSSYVTSSTNSDSRKNTSTGKIKAVKTDEKIKLCNLHTAKTEVAYT